MPNKRTGNVPERDEAGACLATAPRVDRRTLRTHHKLSAALVELMIARDFSAITVQELLDRARVGRATFYAHFRNKDDLLLADQERMFGALQARFEQTPSGRTLDLGTARVAPVAEFFDHVREFRDFVRALDRSGHKSTMFELTTAYFARIIEKRLSEIVRDADTLALPVPVASRAFAAALVETLRWWIDRDAPHSAQWMDDRFHMMVRAAIAGSAAPRP